MNDDTLLCYYYDDGLDAAERRAVRAALAADPALATRYAALVRDLESLAADSPAPAPGDLRERLHAAIDRAADLERGRGAAPSPRSHGLAFLLGAAVTAAVALAIGLRSGGDDPPRPETPAAIAAADDLPPATEPAFVRTMQVYFRDSRREVDTLPDAGNGERTAMVLDLIAENRTFARLAAKNDAPDLARVLRAFEPILTRLAAADITAEESAALREKLDFELNVMLTKLTREASEITTSTEQET